MTAPIQKCNMMTDEAARRRSLLADSSPAGIDDDFALAQHLGGGGRGRSLLKAAGKKGAASSAAVVASASGGLSESQQIDIGQMKGALLVYAVFVIAGILLAGYKYCKARWILTKQAESKPHEVVHMSADVRWDAKDGTCHGGDDAVQLLKALLHEVRTLKQDQTQMAKVLKEMQYERSSFAAAGAHNQGNLMASSDSEVEIATGIPPEDCAINKI